MIPTSRTHVFFERITLTNVAFALFLLVRGNHVTYLGTGSLFGKLPVIVPRLLRLLNPHRLKLSDFLGLTFETHQVALDAAEELHQQIARENPGALSNWAKSFRSERVHLYLKKKLALDSWQLIRSFLIISNLIKAGHPPARLVVTDNALNRILVPYLLGRYPDSGVQVTGLGRSLWRWLQESVDVFFSLGVFLLWLVIRSGRSGFSIHRRVRKFKVSKELLWGLGKDPLKAHDDFVVDGELILSKDVIFYYRRNSALRMSTPQLLQDSISNAKAMGYECVNFDRVPFAMGMLWNVMVHRYLVFPVVISALSLIWQVKHRSAGFLHQAEMLFLRPSAGWEIFLSTYLPDLNLSQDEAVPSHLADTVAINLHGSQNAGFQWADMTQWRAVTLAYVGYNVYFSWGPLAEKYWEGNWAIDQLVHTGYLWGRQYQEGLAQRDEQRRSLTNDSKAPGFVVSLLDEKPSPDLYTSEKMLFDFYRVGAELLERRPDTIVVAKPKAYAGIREFPEILKLIAPYEAAGRFKVWDNMTASAQQVMAMSDVVVSMVMGSPYLEATCCGRTGFNYAPIGNYSSPLYSKALGKIFFDDVDALVDAIEWSLDHPKDDSWAGLEDLRNDVDPYRDLMGMERLRRFIVDMSGPEISTDSPDVVHRGDAVGVP